MLSREDIVSFLNREFPQTKCTVDAVGERSASVRHAIGFDELRPGGTVSGPVLMAVADVALYVAILGEVGMAPMTVTTNLTINFLRKPSAEADIRGDARLIKVGRSLIVGEVELRSGNAPEPVAHVVATYALPRPQQPGQAETTA